MSELYVIEYVVYWVLPTYKCVTVVRVIECYLPTNVSLLLVIEWVRCYSVLPTYKRVTVIGVSEWVKRLDQAFLFIFFNFFFPTHAASVK